MHKSAALLPCIVSIFILSGHASDSVSARAPESVVGDAPPDPGKLATDLSPALKPTDIRAAMRKVADWQTARSADEPSREWPFAILYDGLLSAAKTLNDPRYSRQVLQVAQHYAWTLGPKQGDADDQAIGQSYLYLYGDAPSIASIQPLKSDFDALLQLPDNPAKPVWWWAYALYMAPPVWSGLTAATGDPKYLDYMDRQWHLSSNLLWDQREHLYFRDSTYFDRRESNNRKLFLSRANGWAMAGLVRVIEYLPESDLRRAFYIQQLREMAAAVSHLQSSDGLWRPGLLDAAGYPNPEASSSAFFVYALAWGINHRLLSREQYLPVVRKGWAGLVSHIYADGRLGCIQPVGASGDYPPGASSVYGVGAFLLAGSQVNALAARRN